MRSGRKIIVLVDNLVESLNWIQADVTIDNVINSNKDARARKAIGANFIALCCEKVGLSTGQIKRAIKRNVAKFHRALEYDGFDLALGENVPEQMIRKKSKRARPRSRSPL